MILERITEVLRRGGIVLNLIGSRDGQRESPILNLLSYLKLNNIK